MKSINIFPVLTVVFFVSTIWLLYQKSQNPPPVSSSESTVSLSPNTDETKENTGDSLLSQKDLDELKRLQDLENEHKELKLLLERVSTELKIANKSKEALQSMETGRVMLRDFEKRFLNSQMFREQGGFLAFLRNKSEAYLNRGEFHLKARTMKEEEWRQLHQKLIQWLYITNM